MGASPRNAKIVAGALVVYVMIFLLCIPLRFMEPIRVKQIAGWVDYLLYESWMSQLSDVNPIRTVRVKYIEYCCRQIQDDCSR